MIVALMLASLSPAVGLRWTEGQVLRVDERFTITETRGEDSLSAGGTRRQTWKVRDSRRGQATVDVQVEGVTAEGEGSSEAATVLARDLRTAIDRASTTVVVTDRGRVTLPIAPEGARPFFGLILPGGDRLPKEWQANLVPPFGFDRAIDFRYRSEGLFAEESQMVYRISVRAVHREGDFRFNLSGDLFINEAGEWLRSEIDGRTETKDLVTAISYRARRQPTETQSEAHFLTFR